MSVLESVALSFSGSYLINESKHPKQPTKLRSVPIFSKRTQDVTFPKHIFLAKNHNQIGEISGVRARRKLSPLKVLGAKCV